MRASVSFAAGLWLGGLVVLAAGAVFYRVGALQKRDAPAFGTTTVASSDAEFDRLRQDNAKLTAEAQRLRQTVNELKAGGENAAAFRPRRRGTGGRSDEESSLPTGPVPPAEGAPTAGPAPGRAGLEQLSARARAGDVRALEGLTAVADRGGAPILVRLWTAGGLPAAAQPVAARCLGSIIEISPGAAEALRALLADPAAEEPLVRAALEGIVAPVTAAEGGAAPARPGLNAAGRLEFLEQTVESAGNDKVRELLGAAIEQLTRATESAAQ